MDNPEELLEAHKDRIGWEGDDIYRLCSIDTLGPYTLVIYNCPGDDPVFEGVGGDANWGYIQIELWHGHWLLMDVWDSSYYAHRTPDLIRCVHGLIDETKGVWDDEGYAVLHYGTDEPQNIETLSMAAYMAYIDLIKVWEELGLLNME